MEAKLRSMNLSDRERPTCTSEAGRVAARRSLRAGLNVIMIDKLTKKGRVAKVIASLRRKI
jgi:hypothetical protein